MPSAKEKSVPPENSAIRALFGLRVLRARTPRPHAHASTDLDMRIKFRFNSGMIR
jgi:hypothetical protein